MRSRRESDTGVAQNDTALQMHDRELRVELLLYDRNVDGRWLHFKCHRTAIFRDRCPFSN
jgi:hypothetical protein